MKKILTLSFLLLHTFFVVQAQEITINGKVSDAQGPLPGVNVLVKGTTKGVITDFDGLYSITADSDATLVYSFIGYAKLEIPVNSKTTINAILEESAQQLTETVVVGSRRQGRTKLDTPVPVDVIKIAQDAINMPQ